MPSEDFFIRVYEVVKKIPPGRVTTYGAIAQFLGASKSARIVGWALNSSHTLPNVPAHRVVNRLGVLSGKHHFWGINAMQGLLAEEGVEVKEDKVIAFRNHFWDPNQQLKPEDLIDF